MSSGISAPVRFAPSGCPLGRSGSLQSWKEWSAGHAWVDTEKKGEREREGVVGGLGWLSHPGSNPVNARLLEWKDGSVNVNVRDAAESFFFFFHLPGCSCKKILIGDVAALVECVGESVRVCARERVSQPASQPDGGLLAVHISSVWVTLFPSTSRQTGRWDLRRKRTKKKKKKTSWCNKRLPRVWRYLARRETRAGACNPLVTVWRCHVKGRGQSLEIYFRDKHRHGMISSQSLFLFCIVVWCWKLTIGGAAAGRRMHASHGGEVRLVFS